MKPEEYDIVELLRAIPEHNLTAGARGTVVMDYTRYSGESPMPACEVEFVDAKGMTRALLTVPENDLKVVWRPT
jgi:hypothetical protein